MATPLTADPVAARELALDSLQSLRHQQALSLAYFDVFFVLAVVTVLLVFLVFFMRRSVAEKGAHVAAE